MAEVYKTPYIVVWQISVEKLVEEVNQKVIEGYVPVGGIVFGANKIYQSMISRDWQ